MRCSWLAILVGVLLSLHGEAAPAADAKSKAIYAAPSRTEARAQLTAWLASRGPEAAARQADIERIWSAVPENATGDVLLDALVESFAAVDAKTAELLATSRMNPVPVIAPAALVLPPSADGGSSAPLYRSNVSLYWARWLVSRNLYEEAYEMLQGIGPGAVVDPATYLFLRSVCEHQLLLKTEGLATLGKLLDQTVGTPVRYQAVATLMKSDLEELSPETLDEVARKMSDVRRRLTLGRAGPKVQKKEDEIIATLDEMIKKLEDQSKNSPSSGEGGQQQSNAPAQDSRVKGSTAPGQVDRKKFSNNGAWGSLPDKQRAKAKDLISREFPSHYRQAIEEYTRKAANRTAAPAR